MATEYKLSYTASEIDEKLGKIDNIAGLKTENGGEIFNDYENNQAISSNTHAEGQGTHSGIKGFRISEVDTDSMVIFVDDAELTEKAASEYAIEDILQFDAAGHHYNKLKISSLATNDLTGQSVIGFTKLTDEELNFSLDSDQNENFLWVVGKNYGEVFPMAYGSHAEGEGTIAMGRAAHAEGRQTQAIGGYAHAEGRGTVALYAAHAEGLQTNANGYYSHAEGSKSETNTDYAHAEGFKNKASGSASHAEGFQNTVTGDFSHAEGMDTEVRGIGAHAEGDHTKASSNYQHVQGRYNIEDEPEHNGEGKYAHIVGNGSKDRPSNAHTIDWDGNAWFAGKVTIGDASEELATKTDLSTYAKESQLVGKKRTDYTGAEVFNDYNNNIASNKYAHAEGYYTKATGLGSHAEGYSVQTAGVWYNTQANGQGSHAEGGGTTAQEYCSHAEGYKTTASGHSSHAEGFASTASGTGAHSEGCQCNAEADYSHAGGKGTIADQICQTAIGKYNAEDAKALFIVGNGTNDANRSNAFTVNTDGTVTAGADPVNPMDLVTKQYVSAMFGE